MPNMNGFDATKQIRLVEEDYKLSPNERHYICGFSVDVNAQIEEKCRVSGMDSLISKPISKPGLDDLLKKSKRFSNRVGVNTS